MHDAADYFNHILPSADKHWGIHPVKGWVLSTYKRNLHDGCYHSESRQVIIIKQGFNRKNATPALELYIIFLGNSFRFPDMNGLV